MPGMDKAMHKEPSETDGGALQSAPANRSATEEMLQTGRSMTSVRASFGALIIILITIIGIPLQALFLLLRLPLFRSLPVFYHRIGCWALGVKVREVGTCQTKGAVLITANHCSWLDISVLSSCRALSFIAKSEVSGWPIFGLLAKLQRTIFVNRAKRAKTGEVTREIAARLSEGDPIVLFAEGTSSDGNQVLPFRSALIGAAQVAMLGNKEGQGADKQTRDVWVQPVAIAYTGIQGLPMGRQHRHFAAWYGDMDLMPHLWAILKEGAIDVIVAYGDPIPFGPDASRKQVAKQAEDQVRDLVQKAQARLL